MPNFIQIGPRVINLDLVCGAERRDRGVVALYLAAPGSGGGPMEWLFEEQREADALWLKLSPRGGIDLSDTAGGPYSITDNETTASRQPRDPNAPSTERV